MDPYETLTCRGYGPCSESLWVYTYTKFLSAPTMMASRTTFQLFSHDCAYFWELAQDGIPLRFACQASRHSHANPPLIHATARSVIPRICGRFASACRTEHCVWTLKIYITLFNYIYCNIWQTKNWKTSICICKWVTTRLDIKQAHYILSRSVTIVHTRAHVDYHRGRS